ncbi:hypothetical protein H257_17447 [Aphanomyces astaci]|uniref:Uncharacterized protein n=1 Tax=Aphanomyces astaci TaxID=112090 RepID=W4FGH6_APHAT|nr:hypothetical protein H257_17447 [Aphanomyces astaci]ETV65969.1 hypothetical protein H257_17447 [Aphanomyces astaci]|eukprot:XP_009844548.1 hypothetical protein H257_17447 [Aphanomyces astaci]
MNDDEVTLELDFDHDDSNLPALAKTPKRTRRSPSGAAKRTPLWDDDGVAALFRLRYKSELSARFYSKNNADKKTAYVMLAAELSVATEKEYSVAQVQDKFAKMKSAWSLSKPSNAIETGNAPSAPLPPHYDVMLEYWSDKKGYQRESLMSTDENEIVNHINVKQESGSECEEEMLRSRKKKKSNPSKSKSHSEALEAGFMAIKEGLIHLGSSLSAAPSPQPTPPTGATLDDVLQAIQGQSQTIAQLVAHLIAQKEK